MYNKNKFELIKTGPLLKYIQSEAISLDDPKIKKTRNTKSVIKRVKDLSLARTELIERLQALDNNSPEFFPEGSMIIYDEKPGTVISPDENQLFVKLDGEDFLIKVEPSKLRLINIRHKF